MKSIFSLILSVTIIFQVQSQTVADAVRYSHMGLESTARSMGTGNVMPAIGGDFAAILQNPASLAAYRFNEVVLSPGFSMTTVSSNLSGGLRSFEEELNKVSLNNGSVVFVYKPMRGNWKTTNLSIGFNRLANFNRNVFFAGNTNGTITDRFLELSAGLTANELDAFESGLAYDAFAIFDDPEDSGIWFSDFAEDQFVQKQQRVQQSGSFNEINFSVAGNYDDKFYVGGAINIAFVEFSEEKFYEESDSEDNIPIFNRLLFDETLLTSGSGINFSAGFIYRMSQAIRLGASIKSPTFLGLSDEYSTSLFYSLTDPANPDLSGDRLAESPEGLFEYNLSTPWRANASAGIIIGKTGFIGAVVEYVDYANSKYNLTVDSDAPGDEEYQNELNADIKEELASAINFSVGGELALKDFRLRAGYGLTGSPFLFLCRIRHTSICRRWIPIRQNICRCSGQI